MISVKLGVTADSCNTNSSIAASSAVQAVWSVSDITIVHVLVQL